MTGLSPPPPPPGAGPAPGVIPVEHDGCAVSEAGRCCEEGTESRAGDWGHSLVRSTPPTVAQGDKSGHEDAQGVGDVSGAFVVETGIAPKCPKKARKRPSAQASNSGKVDDPPRASFAVRGEAGEEATAVCDHVPVVRDDVRISFADLRNGPGQLRRAINHSRTKALAPKVASVIKGEGELQADGSFSQNRSEGFWPL